MGNKICCEQQQKQQFDHTITVVHKQQPIRIPQLHPIVASHLQRQKPFYNQLIGTPTVKQYGVDIYQGQVDQRGRPNGFGKMYHKNGSVFIGQFYQGIANGLGHYIKNDGSFYHGKLKNNMANDDNGFYKTSKFQYRGSVINNQIEGKGKQIGQYHTYQGIYKNGQKIQGILKWKQGNNQFQYTGPFNNQGNFQGKGQLWQKGKGVYKGDFINGYKHGKGQYDFDSGLKYIGQYYRGVKEGYGKIVGKNGNIAYQGNFKNGMPHGKGIAPNQNGQLKQRDWIDGIDKLLIED